MANNQTKRTPKKDGPPKERPVRVIRIRDIRGNIWANRLDDGRILYNVTIDRLWKEPDQVNEETGEVTKPGQWQQSPSFGKDDLLLVAKVADLCHSEVYRRIQDDAREHSF